MFSGGIWECRPAKSGFQMPDKIEKNGVGNAYMRSVELRFVVFSRATGCRQYRMNNRDIFAGDFCCVFAGD